MSGREWPTSLRGIVVHDGVTSLGWTEACGAETHLREFLLRVISSSAGQSREGVRTLASLLDASMVFG